MLALGVLLAAVSVESAAAGGAFSPKLALPVARPLAVVSPGSAALPRLPAPVLLQLPASLQGPGGAAAPSSAEAPQAPVVREDGAPQDKPAEPAAPKPAFAPGTMALIQYDGDAHFGDYEHNLRRLTEMAEGAVAQGAKIVVLPEGALYGYATKDELWCKPGMTEFNGKKCRDVAAVAERVPGGRSTEHWAAFSRRHGVYVLFNIPETDGAAFYNSMGVTGPEGPVAVYRKRQLYHTDQAYAAAGTDPVVLKTPYGCFGLLVCLDASPQSPYFEEYKAMEANALIIAMDWDDDPRGEYAARLKFREWALEHAIDIYASDAAPWDGAGKYLASGGERQRDGLPPDGVGVEGVSLHSFHY